MSVSNHRRLDCLLNRLLRCRSKKTSLGVTGLCEGNSLVTSEFPSQRTSNAENMSIWWSHHESKEHCTRPMSNVPVSGHILTMQVKFFKYRCSILLTGATNCDTYDNVCSLSLIDYSIYAAPSSIPHTPVNPFVSPIILALMSDAQSALHIY